MSSIVCRTMQASDMDVLLTLLILTPPPMAAFFFQGTLGSFMAYSQIGGAASAGGSPGPQGQAPGSYVSQRPVEGSASVGSERNRQLVASEPIQQQNSGSRASERN
ncbi:hypothetical protein [Xanthomonas campestris]|uniref:hypothetical protein n=1 Tax=Xanthomonas campestris TaxID=339 RepID=UPI003CE6EFBA